MFRGRETAHPHLGKKILDEIAERAVNMAKVEAAPKLDGRNMIMVLAPDKRAQAAAKAARPEAAGGDFPESELSPNGAVEDEALPASTADEQNEEQETVDAQDEN
jgi:translation initiation factor IF-3